MPGIAISAAQPDRPPAAGRRARFTGACTFEVGDLNGLSVWVRGSVLSRMGWLLGLCLFATSAHAEALHDLVIRGGRVIDPASGSDRRLDIAVDGGTISALAESGLSGTREVDASGLVVAPGFIDLHQHGQHRQAYRLSVQDGVTSSFEIEVGVTDIASWYAARAGGQPINYGVGAGHIQARMDVLRDPSESNLPSGPAAFELAGNGERTAIVERVRAALDAGAVAVGMGPEYTPGADDAELRAVLSTAAAFDASVHVHLPAGVAGLERMLRLARETGVRLHVVHVNSAAGEALPDYLSAIRAARVQGQAVTVEAYPYGASMTRIEAAKFSDWQDWPDEKFGRFQWAASGEWLSRDSFGAYRVQGGIIIYHARSEALTAAALADPMVMVASDGFIDGEVGHPRASGSFSRVLGRYVREDGVLDLMPALRKMTVQPARVLERRVPAMARKGRLCVGCDADLVLFDPDKVRDRATFDAPGQPSVGIEYVLVNGQLVVSAGELVPNALPGRPVRAPSGGIANE